MRFLPPTPDLIRALLATHGLRCTSAAKLAGALQGNRMDFAVRGVCADCATGASP